MPDFRPSVVHHAIVLAAGDGDRFHSTHKGAWQSKLVTPLAGTPLLIRTLDSARRAGITTAHVVLGYDAERVRLLASTQGPHGLTLHFHLNRQWHQENGLSVLAVRASMTNTRFALLMGDHVFDPEALQRLINAASGSAGTLLAVDHQPYDPSVAEEATKVRLDGDRVTAIGKTLYPYDALDMGLFVSDPTLFTALDESCADGDTTLSGGVRRQAARGLVRGVDIGRFRWFDIDTVGDLERAEELMREVSHR